MAKIPQSHLRDIVTDFWDARRSEIRAGAWPDVADLSMDRQLPHLLAHVKRSLRPNLRRVLNGAGVVIHTNLGRSILAREAVEAVLMAAGGYCNLEMDMATGERGSRHAITEDLMRRLTGAEAAMVVNNNAAAVLLILDELCANGEVIVSRGELVEIGGSFRIPDIMARSGAILREVGATNRTHLKDYQKAVNEKTRAIMRVHTSNFRIVGFHSSVPTQDLRALCDAHGLPLIFDLGSGSLLDFSEQGLPREPTVAQALAEGADCVSFSGDKVLGGPQAGIIAGRKDILDRLKKNPLARALRCDKLCLGALEATLRLYLDPEKAREHIPTPRMLSRSREDLAGAARLLAMKIRKALAEDGECEISLGRDSSRAGGGAFPEFGLPTTLVRLRPQKGSPQSLRQLLLEAEPPLVGRLEADAFCLDPRTLERAQFGEVAGAVAWALAELGRREREAQRKG